MSSSRNSRLDAPCVLALIGFACAVLVAVNALAIGEPRRPLAYQFAYQTVYACTFGACLVASHVASRRSRRRMLAWCTLAIATATIPLAVLTNAVADSQLTHRLADAIALLFYPLAAAALALLAPERRPMTRVKFVLDIAIVFAAMLALSVYAFLVGAKSGTFTAFDGLPLYAVLTPAAACIMVVPGIALALQPAGVREDRPVTWLLAALGLVLLADLLAVIVPMAMFINTMGWAMAMAVLAVAACFESRRGAAPAAVVDPNKLTRGSLLPVLVVAPVMVAAFVESAGIRGPITRTLALCILSLTVLVLVRQFAALRENRELLRERLELQVRLLQAQKMEAIGRLAGGIAHDFNNVLTAILGYTDTLEQDLPRGSARIDDVREIGRAGRRAADLTRELLEFARRQAVAPTMFDLNALVSEVERLLRQLLGPHIELRLVLASEPLPVIADPSQIERVLVNLALNARDAMSDGGALTLETAASSGRDVIVRVTDTGVGIAADVLDKVFEPFFTTKPAGRGTGLGLASVYGMVHQAGGQVAVESEVGRGARFTVTLPRGTPLPAWPVAIPQPIVGPAES